MTKIDNKFESTQSGRSHDLLTHSVNKYVTYTHNAQIRLVSIWKMLPGGDNDCRTHIFGGHFYFALLAVKAKKMSKHETPKYSFEFSYTISNT